MENKIAVANWMNYKPGLVKDLTEKGWCVLEDFFPKELTLEILMDFKDRLEDSEFKFSKVGRKLDKTLDLSVRNAQSTWVELSQGSSGQKILNEFYNSLKEFLNESFFLSLKRYESQYAFYPNGGFYKKHTDQLKNSMHRQVTSIYYLANCDSGGELVIYNKNNKKKVDFVFKPKAGSLVVFFSALIYHEVLKNEDPRYSLTSWFRDDLIIF